MSPEAEVVAIGIVDAAGAVLLDSLVRPQGLTAWPEAHRIHGISPDDVASAPTWPKLAPEIQAAVQDRHVVIYNAAFDCRFLGPLLAGCAQTRCCMEAWAHYVREWSDYWGGYRWHKLVEAAAEVEFDWTAESLGDRPHSAVADARGLPGRVALPARPPAARRPRGPARPELCVPAPSGGQWSRFPSMCSCGVRLSSHIYPVWLVGPS